MSSLYPLPYSLHKDIYSEIFTHLFNAGNHLWTREVCKGWCKAIDGIIRLKWEKLKQSHPSSPLLLEREFSRIEKKFSVQLENVQRNKYLEFFRRLNVYFAKNGALISQKEIGISWNHFNDLQKQILQKKQDQSLLLMWKRLLKPLFSVGIVIELNVKEIRDWLENPESLPIRESILKLDLSDLGIRFIPSEVSFFTEIADLNLSSNYIDLLPDFLKDLGKLKKLNLYDNTLTVLPDDFSDWTHLEEINLKDNSLDAQSLEKLELWKRNKQEQQNKKARIQMEIDPDNSF